MELLNVLRALEPNSVAYTFIGFMLVAFLMAITAIARRRHPRYQQFAPNLLTTVGILGTFVGISIGLAEFNTKDISLNDLMEKMIRVAETGSLDEESS